MSTKRASHSRPQLQTFVPRTNVWWWVPEPPTHRLKTDSHSCQHTLQRTRRRNHHLLRSSASFDYDFWIFPPSYRVRFQSGQHNVQPTRCRSHHLLRSLAPFDNGCLKFLPITPNPFSNRVNLSWIALTAVAVISRFNQQRLTNVTENRLRSWILVLDNSYSRLNDLWEISYWTTAAKWRVCCQANR